DESSYRAGSLTVHFRLSDLRFHRRTYNFSRFTITPTSTTVQTIAGTFLRIDSLQRCECV
ncbi:MAG: hypothetical protein ACYST2_05595, partial [Planctomycetota bacterium]